MLKEILSKRQARKRGKIRIAYTKTLREELDRYPTWPPENDIELGRVGSYDSNTKTFSWDTTLAALGVEIEPTKPSGAGDSLFSSQQVVDAEVQVDGGIGQANFRFGAAGAVVTQTTSQGIVELPEPLVKSELAARVADGSIQWDFSWRFVTRVYVADTATILVRRSKGGGMSLRTSVPVSGALFNLADPDLGVGVHRRRGSTWTYLARSSPTPWFEVHYLQLVDGKVILHRA